MKAHERRLHDLAANPPELLPCPPEWATFFDSLSIPTLKFLNRRWRQLEERGASEDEVRAMLTKAQQLSDLDRAGMLTDGWWNSDDV